MHDPIFQFMLFLFGVTIFLIVAMGLPFFKATAPKTAIAELKANGTLLYKKKIKLEAKWNVSKGQALPIEIYSNGIIIYPLFIREIPIDRTEIKRTILERPFIFQRIKLIHSAKFTHSPLYFNYNPELWNVLQHYCDAPEQASN